MIHKVEISVSGGGNPGQVARQIGAYLAHESRYRTSYTRSYGDALNQPPQMGPIPEKTMGYHDRSAVNALLREDARLRSEFAAARRAAVLAYAEAWERDKALHLTVSRAEDCLASCLEYERLRGGGGKPSGAALRFCAEREGLLLHAGLVAYEAARSHC